MTHPKEPNRQSQAAGPPFEAFPAWHPPSSRACPLKKWPVSNTVLSFGRQLTISASWPTGFPRSCLLRLRGSRFCPLTGFWLLRLRGSSFCSLTLCVCHRLVNVSLAFSRGCRWRVLEWPTRVFRFLPTFHHRFAFDRPFDLLYLTVVAPILSQLAIHTRPPPLVLPALPVPLSASPTGWLVQLPSRLRLGTGIFLRH